jgi:hypothetical protein
MHLVYQVDAVGWWRGVLTVDELIDAFKLHDRPRFLAYLPVYLASVSLLS